jgi:hypothetical protein
MSTKTETETEIYSPTDAETHAESHASATETADPRPRRQRLPLRTALRRHGGQHNDWGQATSEYALVILVAAAIAFSVIAWARNTDAFTTLFDTVIGRLTSN